MADALLNQRVEVRQEPSGRYSRDAKIFYPDVVQLGRVQAFTHALAASGGFLDNESRIVVLTDGGRFLFARPHQVTVLGSPEQRLRAECYAELEEQFRAAQEREAVPA